MLSIYTPSGKALEYCERAVNLSKGCSHRCLYCYSPLAIHVPREAFGKPSPRDGILEALAKEAPKHAGKEVLMSFTSDPCYSEEASERSCRAIAILHGEFCRVTILTKGGRRARPLIALLRPGDKFGVTLTFDNDKDSLQWEPGAALPSERIEVLREAKAKGISTWVSFEPVIDPEQTLRLIESVVGVADLVKLGKWNHDTRANAIDWHGFAVKSVALCEYRGVAFKLKKDLAAYLNAGPEKKQPSLF